MTDINPKNILVVQIGKLGDMVLTNPLFYELKRLFPDASLKVLASPVNQEFVSQLSVVDEVIVYHKSILKDLFLANKLKKNEFDLWIDVKNGYSRTSSSLLKLAKPKLSLGFNTKEKIFDVDLNEFVKGKHAVDLSLAPVYYFGKEPVNVRPVLKDFTVDASETKFDLLINVSAGSPSRYLSESKWSSLIAKIFDKHPRLQIYLLGIERDSKLILDIYKTFRTEHITYNYNCKLTKLINILDSSNIIMSTDTSIIHLASGLNKPVIGLYPKVDWNFERFKPLSDNFETIISDSEKGLEDINVNEIFEKYEKLVQSLNQ